MDVELPDGTIIKGVPDGTSKAQLATKLKANGKTVPDDWLPTTKEKEEGLGSKILHGAEEAVGSVAEPLAKMATGAIAKPVSDVAGLVATAKEAISPTPGRTGKEPQQFKEDVQRALTYDPRTTAGKSEYNPLNAIPNLVGQGISAAGGAAGRGAEYLGGQVGLPPSVTGPLGRGVKEAVEQAPTFLGIKAVPAASSAVSRALKGADEGAGRFTARGMMQSALKPPVEALRTGKATSAVDTLLNEGANVSKGGLEKLQTKVSAINDKISKLIDKSPAVIDKAAVASRLNEVLEKFNNQVTPLSDIRSIQKAWDEFMEHPLLKGDTIPVKTAQSMKQGTYRSLGSKSYGELKGADVEAQKALARGLKEEIAKAVPKVKKLNAQESKLLTALPLVERRVLMEANKNPVGLGLLSLSPSHMVAFMADRSGLFKSLVARMLNTASTKIPSMKTAGPIAGYGATTAAHQVDLPPQ